jgi:hypothetical protein
MKSPNSMKNERFHPSKWQGSKNGSAVHPYSQNTRPISKLPHITKNKIKLKKLDKGGR